jgi:hypothetical protein
MEMELSPKRSRRERRKAVLFAKREMLFTTT